MSGEYDSPWKEALERFFPQFLALLFPQIHDDIDWNRGYHLLSTELEQITREAELGTRWADVLVKVFRRNGSEIWVLIHVEIQAQHDADFPERMFVYHYRIFDLYQRPVVSLAILADERPNWRPDHYEHVLWGCRARLDFPTVKLLDFQADLDLLESNENPFAALIVAHRQSQATRNDPTQRLAWKARLFRALFQRNLTAEDIRELLRIIDWFLELPQELEQQFRHDYQAWKKEQTMPFVASFDRFAREEGFKDGKQEGFKDGKQEGFKDGKQEGFKDGKQEGFKDGKQEGFKDGKQEGQNEGKREGLLEGIELLLNVKFGPDGLAQLPDVQKITDLEKLRALARLIPNTKTLEEFRALLTN